MIVMYLVIGGVFWEDGAAWGAGRFGVRGGVFVLGGGFERRRSSLEKR